MTSHLVVIGDARDMGEVADESVDLVVTSPPYWQLKDYGAREQIGFDHSYEEYINNLNLVWQESHRVLHGGCRLCINIGDQFARSIYYGRYKVIPIRTEITRFCETIGFDYMGSIIWQKVTTCNTSGGGAVMGSYPFPRNGIIKVNYEFILVFRKLGKQPKVTKEIKTRSRLTSDEWNLYFSGHWQFPGEKQGKHIAVFPEELPRRLIRMFTFEGETVLDPFLGSGTTTLAARNLGRNSVGYEINKDFLPIIEAKTEMNRPGLFGDTNVRVFERIEPERDYAQRIEQLPYVFLDPSPILRSESAAIATRRGAETKQPSLHSVKEIVSPEVIVLSNNRKIRLLGVREKHENNEEAVQFLRDLTKGKKVFYRLDGGDSDTDPLPCYLYLKNKTFINARLIKSGFVEVDTENPCRQMKRFLNYGESVNKVVSGSED
jgi:modification methylase